MLKNLDLSRLISYLSNNLSGRLKNWTFSGKKRSDAYNKCCRTFTMMLIISRLIILYGKGKEKFAEEYLRGVSSSPGLGVEVGKEFSDLTIKLLSSQDSQDVIFYLTDKIWGTYALDPTTVENNLRKDYRDKFNTPKTILPKDENKYNENPFRKLLCTTQRNDCFPG